ncbi:MAG: radical SAM protein [Alphaproteobacteria bacterium]|nr:radical SAM protein [Alphaproteobacteria bacterium]
MPAHLDTRVLVVTGTLLAADERSARAALGKQLASMRASSGPWLDLRLKLLAAEELLAQRAARRERGWWSDTVDRLFTDDGSDGTPELTEVLLATLLQVEGVPFEVASIAALTGDAALRRELLGRCGVVFLSSTLLRDASELTAVVRLVRRPGTRLVVGGALAPLLAPGWSGDPAIDVLAVGEGERLVPALAAWVRGGELVAPEGGEVRRAGPSLVVRAGPSPERTLDAWPCADWSLAMRVHGRTFPSAFYESVRGCPYRCAFCNYPYLFDDQRFRTRSARRIADDWTAMVEAGVRRITCLDSLFTLPPRRLDELCALLVERDLPLEWICYARADDLTDERRVAAMRAAGCVQVQIGVESGDDGMLRRMDKRTTVAQSALALEVCRRQGVVTLCTFIAGYPGETRRTLRATRDFVLRTRPDFYYLAPFTTRVLGVPVLSEDSRRRHGIRTVQGITSSAPYWRHDTMSADELPTLLREHNATLVAAEAALDATLFYPITARYRPADRAAMLAFQTRMARSAPWWRAGLRGVGTWVQRRLERDLQDVLG